MLPSIRLRSLAETAVEHFPDGRDADSLALGAGGEPDQLFDKDQPD
jgi:hypothetical protein